MRWKASVLEPLFNKLACLNACQYCEIFKNRSCYRTHPVAASKRLSSILETLLRLENFVVSSIFPIFYQFYQVHITLLGKRKYR